MNDNNNREANEPMRIAVCDDEKPELEKILGLLREYDRARQDLSLTLSAFSGAESLLNFVDEYGGFDLYILDIVMPETNGIQLGSSLRKLGEEGMIVYLTNSPDFAVDSYTVEALGYLLKPVGADSLFSCLDKAADRFALRNQNVVIVRMSRSERAIPVWDILYAERVRRLVAYHTRSGPVINSATFNGTFQNAVASLLEHREFLLVGSSFAVNLRHVTEITRHNLVIAGEYRISIPRGKYEAYKSAWSDYWLNYGGK